MYARLADLAGRPAQHHRPNPNAGLQARRPWPRRPRAQQGHREHGRSHRLRRHRTCFLTADIALDYLTIQRK